jgi:hypothetical protein
MPSMSFVHPCPACGAGTRLKWHVQLLCLSLPPVRLVALSRGLDPLFCELRLCSMLQWVRGYSRPSPRHLDSRSCCNTGIPVSRHPTTPPYRNQEACASIAYQKGNLPIALAAVGFRGHDTCAPRNSQTVARCWSLARTMCIVT